MSSGETAPGVTVAATGWRFYPWGWRITWSLLFVIGLAYTYELGGQPSNLAGVLWIALVPSVVAGSLWVIFEVQSQRRITVLPTGVVMVYPGRRTFVPWDRVRFSSTQPHRWFGDVLFLEVGRKSVLGQLAHYVTRAQAKAILVRMPNRPTDPQARLLLGAEPGQVRVLY
jgi:hypothetical protein